MYFLWHRIAIVSIILPLMSCIGHNNLTEGIRDFRVQNYRQAFIRLTPEAKKGQPDAQYAIGYMYYYGQGVVEDRKKAWYWINQAAQAKQAEAMAALNILQQE